MPIKLSTTPCGGLAMTTITDIFRTYSDDYIEKFGKNIPELHKKAIHDIVNCRTQSSGILIYECKECGKTHLVMRSCGNRHCPCCQNHKTSQWLDRQLDRQLPGHHFMITFTVPEQLRNFIRSNQKLSYSAMFDASSQTLKDFAADDRFVGGDLPGFFGVLHTWDANFNIIHIYTILCRAGLFQNPKANGTLLVRTFLPR